MLFSPCQHFFYSDYPTPQNAEPILMTRSLYFFYGDWPPQCFTTCQDKGLGHPDLYHTSCFQIHGEL